MKRLAVALLVVLAALASTVVGHAAALQVGSSSLATFSAQHPCPGQAAAVPSNGSGSTFSGVTLTLPSGACSGSLVKATVLTSAGLVVVQGQVEADGATATLAVPTYTAGSSYTVQATVGGWHLPTTWSFTPPVVAQPFTAGNPATVIDSVTWSTTGGQTCAVVTVTTTSVTSVRWRVDVNVAAAPFHGATTGYSLKGQVLFEPSATPVNGVIGVVGSVNGWDTLSAGQTRSFTLCR